MPSNNYILARLQALPWRKIGYITVVVVIIGLITSVITTYNHIVALRTDADAQWQQVEVQYQRRLDLIPNLVGAAKGAQLQETTVFTQVADARARYETVSSTNDKAAAATQVDSALSQLLVVVEAYPELKSNEMMLNLQAELAATEDRIGAERLAYNDDVRSYNRYIRAFPDNLVAATFGFRQKVYFESSLHAELAPLVNNTQ